MTVFPPSAFAPTRWAGRHLCRGLPVGLRHWRPTIFSLSIEQQRRKLYAQTVKQMGQRMQSATDPSDLTPMFAALRWGMNEIDRTCDDTPAKVRASVACRAGCSHCCSAAVDVQAHEVFFVAEHIQLHFSAEELAGVTARTAALRALLFAVMLGMDAALECAGYDDRSYDFNSALHEALTNSLCRTLWLSHKAAFPGSCLSPE